MSRIRNSVSFISYETGITLIEAVISMAIFAIGFLAITGLVIATTNNNTAGNRLTEATMLARTQVEYLKALPLDRLAAACLDENEPEIINQIYARTCEVSKLGSTNTIRTIKVTVKWKKSGRLKQITLQTNTRGRGK